MSVPALSDYYSSAQALVRLWHGHLAWVKTDAGRLAVLLAALHDLGKFAAYFQRKADGPVWPFSRPRDALFAASQHDKDGLSLWHYRLGHVFAPRIWPRAERALQMLIGASVGHHGRAVALDTRSPAEAFQAEGIEAATACVEQLVARLLPSPVAAAPPGDAALAAASFWFAGFVTIADWAGSSQAFFPYRSPVVSMGEYWRET